MTKGKHTGITAIFTGDGKGKTSAALGVVFRALGHDMNCKIIQFIKGDKRTGELALMERLKPGLDIEQTGKGFTWKKNISQHEHRKAAQAGIRLAAEAIASDEWSVIVLDEVLYAIKAGLVTVEQIEELIDLKPAGKHLILTGRGAPKRLIDKADMVTSMENVKHPMQAGITAQKGMDY
ncbi:Cob(I)alamin adenosyltransferase [hydrothermal vent metagenome]|uniref:Cob(I)alamin adenosyltransferase n=1 Tax=hydrothermal vent metagenome TaxID=652676 RepID=A0A3B1C5T2_9ZZZZ